MNYENVVLPDDYPDGLNVLAGETADNTAIRDGGVMNVESDGLANSTTVSGGGAFTLYSGGSADTLVISSAGRATISGAVTNLIHSGGYMEVWGGTISGGGAYGSQSKDTALNALANLGSNAVLRDFTMTTLSSFVGNNMTWYNIGWNQLTDANGSATAYNVTVDRMARFQVNWGAAYNTQVLSRGSMLVERGGNAFGITLSAAGNSASLSVNNTLGGVAADITILRNGVVTVVGGSASSATIRTSGVMTVRGGRADDLTLSGGLLTVSGGVASDVKLSAGSAVVSGGVASDVTVLGGELTISNGTVAGAALSAGNTIIYGGTAAAAVVSGGTVDISGGSASDTLLRTGTVNVSGGAAYDTTMVGGTLNIEGGAVIGGAITGGTLRVSGGTLSSALVGLNATVLYDTGRMVDVVFSGKGTQIARMEGGTVSGGVLSNIALSMTVANGNCISGLVISSGGLLRHQTNGASAGSNDFRDITVCAGGTLRLYHAGTASSYSGKLTLDLTGAKGCDTALVQRSISVINNLADIVVIASEEVGDYTYLLTELDTIAIVKGQIAPENNTITFRATSKVYNPFLGQSYILNRDTSANKLWLVTAPEEYAYTVAATAGALETAMNASDRAAKWDATTEYTGAVNLAAAMTSAGNVWLEVAGLKDDAEATIYGTSAGQELDGAINLKLTGGSIRNLAAGAAAGGSVKAVNFEMAGGELAGNTYAGGMGDVTEAANTTIAGGTLAAEKNFYAGALWNKQSTATSVGKVTLTVKGGELKGNVYGASAVKTGAIATADNDAAKHTVGDVTISLANGTATDHKFCVFAGGYATGTDSTKLASVYDVGDIDVSVTGGTWGDADDAWGGRGLFGGVFASGVKATAEDVTITITGGTFGNVFGGGWAQKNGVSVVDDVEITISGGTIANVFGGGTHSTSGGSTIVDDVSINISGGTITGAIYARGQADGDVVTGDEVSVTFTGDTNFGCGVFGYSYVGGEKSDAMLSYTAYTGTFSGNIGGFDSIVFDDDTAMTLTTASADVLNGKWEFDFTDRAAELAGTSFLTWSTADFAGDTVKVNFTDAAQAAAGWNIATAAFTGASFDLYIGGTEITSVAYDTAIANGDWAGWKFTDENGTLKFKQLA